MKHLKSILILCLTLNLYPLANTAQAQTLNRIHYANGYEVRKVFAPTIKNARKSTLTVLHDLYHVAYATAITKDGYAITKASQLKTHAGIRLVDYNGKTYPVKVIAIDYKQDIALLKAKTNQFVPIIWKKNISPKPGAWVITPSTKAIPLAVGMVSVEKRKLRRASKPMLGVLLPDSIRRPARIQAVYKGTGAKQAGLRPGDIIINAAGIPLKNKDHLLTVLAKHKPGQWVNLIIQRGTHIIRKRVNLGTWVSYPIGQAGMQNTLGGSLSNHRAGYSHVIQHDTPLKPYQCGGPIVDLQGNAYGINIARVGRVESYILPAADLIPIIKKLKANPKNHIATSKK